MSRSSLERFLFRFDKEPSLQAALKEQQQSTFEGFDLIESERQVLLDKDAATLYEWGVHPLLIRNFCGTLGLKYTELYNERGIRK